MTSTDAWADFDTLRHNVKHNTVDKLKHILTGFNDECLTHIAKSGKKQELIDRIQAQMDNWRSTSQDDKWTRAKAILYQVQNTGSYSSRPTMTTTMSSTTTTTNGYVSPVMSRSLNGLPATSSIGAYNPYAPPRRPAAGPSAPLPNNNNNISNGSVQRASNIRFKPSPFFRIDQQVSAIQECPESISSTDRKSQYLTFTLTSEQVQKLNDPTNTRSAKYQIRLFCTSSFFYSPAPSFRTTSGPCPIEFPPTCEIRVNQTQLAVNLKGMKKKPGTTPPADLGRLVRTTPHQQPNRVEMVYVNSQQPVQSKKFYLVAMLVETTSVDQLVDRLMKGKFRSGEDIRSKMAQSAQMDDDIIAGPQKMSLKCPLTMMRVNTPCRSSHCVHSQCFDATSWLMINEQTTTWMCPVCERTINYDDIIVDGYFTEILKQVPDSVEDVMVEPDGEWHTTDNKYASTTWKAAHPQLVRPPVPPRRSESMQKPPSSSASPSKSANSSNGGSAKGKERAAVFVLDSDEEDEGIVKRELSPSLATGSSISAQASLASIPPQSQMTEASSSVAPSNVIDLTLDSDDDEDDPPPPPPQRVPVALQDLGRKRKAGEAGLTNGAAEEAARRNRHHAMAVSMQPNGNSASNYVAPRPNNTTTNNNNYNNNNSISLTSSPAGGSNHGQQGRDNANYLPLSVTRNRLPPPPLPRAAAVPLAQQANTSASASSTGRDNANYLPLSVTRNRLPPPPLPRATAIPLAQQANTSASASSTGPNPSDQRYAYPGSSLSPSLSPSSSPLPHYSSGYVYNNTRWSR